MAGSILALKSLRTNCEKVLFLTRFIKRPSKAILFWKDLLKYIPEYLLCSRSLAITIFPLPRRYRELEMAGTILRYRQYF